MRRQDFSYTLPEALIAYKPIPERAGSRLLSLNGISGDIKHQHFPDILDHLQAGDVMVFNDTKVIPARLYGKKATGGQVEILVERLLDEYHVLAHLRSSKSPKAGATITLDHGFTATVEGRAGSDESLFQLCFQESPVLEVLEQVGHVPLPPYITRDDEPEDYQRYQTVYSRELGAVAAPTAGLHFDEALLQAIKDKGVEIVYVTLHVGAGTFQPIRVDTVADHVMHSEVAHVSPEVCEVINTAKQQGRRVIAVGTTSVRSLESAAVAGKLAPLHDETDIFITPGYDFQIVDVLLTNFHLSESTLLMLVSAFAGYQHTMHAYQQAVAEQYRFFSYGDAMLITRNPEASNTFQQEIKSLQPENRKK